MTYTLKKERLMRLAEVIERTGLSRSMIYLSIRNGDFPPNVRLGPRCVGWIESEIDAWIQGRINQRAAPQ